MTSTTVDYRLRIELGGALAIGSGPVAVGSLGEFPRDNTGTARIPASTLKGAIRSTLERLLAGSAVEATSATAPQDAGASTDCPVARLFGAPGREGLIRWSDARIVDDTARHVLGNHRGRASGLALRAASPRDRIHGRSVDASLPVREIIPPGLEPLRFEARIQFRSPLSAEDRSLLETALRVTDQIGADRSRGLGHVTLTLCESPPVVRGRSPRAPVTAAEGETGASPTPAEAPPQAPASARLILTALEPFRVTSTEAPGGQASDRLPGGAVRAALAAALTESGSAAERADLLERLLSSSGPRVSEAVPMGRRVAVSTLVTCEALPGFHLRAPGTPAATAAHPPTHGAWDLLLIDFVNTRKPAGRATARPRNCPLDAVGGGTCGARLTPLTDAWVTDRTSDDPLTAPRTLVGRRRTRGASQSVDVTDFVIPARGVSRYEAQLHGLDPELLIAIGGLDDLHLGAGRTRGTGRFGVRVDTVAGLDLADSITRLDEALVRIMDGWPGGALTRTDIGLERQRLVALDLQSSWIPTRPSGSITEALAHDLHGLGPVEVVAVHLDPVRVGGWNGPAGLPHGRRRAFAAGGVVLLSFLLAHEEQVVAGLETLAREGMGQDCRDGHGRFLAGDPVHWERVPPISEGR